MDNNRRVVVTGLGVVSSIGIGWEEFWKNLLAGKSGISRVEAFDTSGCERHYAGEVKNFDPSLYGGLLSNTKIGRTSQLACAAAKLAFMDSHFSTTLQKKLRGSVCVGTTNGENDVLERIDNSYFYDNGSESNEQDFAFLPTNLISSSVAKLLQICGHNYLFGTACASGNYSLGMGYDLLRSNLADYAVVGGADSLSRITYTGFERLYSIAPERCQPFDLNRQGMIPGEGAGMLFIETLESAQKRNATIYAEVLGYGLSCDAQHMTNPDSQSVSRAMTKSLQLSELNPEDINYISAHGTGTLENDKAECEAIYRVFENAARRIPVSSIKSMLGHTMGAASALESIACCLALQHKEIPPTINFENSDPFCDIDCVPNKSRQANIKVALNCSQAFGGNNSCLALGII